MLKTAYTSNGFPVLMHASIVLNPSSTAATSSPEAGREARLTGDASGDADTLRTSFGGVALNSGNVSGFSEHVAFAACARDTASGCIPFGTGSATALCIVHAIAVASKPVTIPRPRPPVMEPFSCLFMCLHSFRSPSRSPVQLLVPIPEVTYDFVNDVDEASGVHHPHGNAVCRTSRANQTRLRTTHMARTLSEMRLTYDKGELDDDRILPHPMSQFERWFAEVRSTDVQEANAMIVSTVDATGHPSARTVLLKAFDESGFVFYTNYESQKGREISGNPAVALTFYWPTLERQVRVSGTAERVSAEQSDAYFSSRPPGSQLSAIISPQSSVIPDRSFLTVRLAEATARHDDVQSLARPANWGGYRVTPHTIEFWQGRPDRLHDRIRYSQKNGQWIAERLAP